MSKLVKTLPLAAFVMRRLRDGEPEQQHGATRRAGSTAKVAGLIGAGATAAYLFDPEQGRGRRARLLDQLGGAARRQTRDLERTARYAQGRAEGAMARMSGAGTPHPADDRAVTDLIRQTLAGLDCATNQVVIDVAGGTATLRGQVPHLQDVGTVELAVDKVPGVRAVESFLHLPKTPAPNKTDAIEASRLPGSRQVVHHG